MFQNFENFTWAFASPKALKPYWNEYRAIFQFASKPQALRCKHCSQTFSHPRRHGDMTTTPIKNHIEKRCAAYKRKNSHHQASASNISAFLKGDPNQTSSSITQEEVEEQILKFFISGNIAFNQADNPHFRKLIEMIEVNGKPARAPGRTTIRARLSHYSQLSDVALIKVLAENKSKISLALDCWSSRANHSYLGTFVTEF
jgi:hypothetical protein